MIERRPRIMSRQAAARIADRYCPRQTEEPPAPVAFEPPVGPVQVPHDSDERAVLERVIRNLRRHMPKRADKVYLANEITILADLLRKHHGCNRVRMQVKFTPKATK